jgi:hypothetical protein
LALICSSHEDSFENNGELLTSAAAHEGSMKKIGIPTACVVSVGGFAGPRRKLLEFHRTNGFSKRDLEA